MSEKKSAAKDALEKGILDDVSRPVLKGLYDEYLRILAEDKAEREDREYYE